MKKYQIEQNTVQETLVIPLYGKKRCAERYPNFFQDPSALALVERLDYDWSRQKSNLITRFGEVESGMRELDLVWEVRDYLRLHPKAAVVNMGCGLDDLFPRVDNGSIQLYSLDHPDVITMRNELMPPRERETNLAVDLNDFSWMKQISFSQEDGAVFMASGVFYYFHDEEIKALFQAMEQAFPGGRLAFDTGNRRALKMMLRAYLKSSGMDLDAYFYLKDLNSLKAWLPRSLVSSRGYMTGYHKLDPEMPWFYHPLSRISDSFYGMCIVRIDF